MDADLDRRLADLMRRAQDGDRPAYATLLAEVARLVRAFAERRLRGGDFEDIVQETLLSLHRARHTYDPERAFGPWMYAIARHRLSDHTQKARRLRKTEVMGHDGIEELPQESHPAEPRSGGLLTQALERLTRNQREVIQMMKIEDRSVAEISRRTGLTISSVKVTAHRGYKRLRKLLGSRP